ncbi:MAG: hypothetical protein AAGB16_09090 [Pseudomonadota bacterium]
MKTYLITLLSATTIVACASTPETSSTDAGSSSPSAAERAIDQTEAGLGDAALSPLKDVNLKRDEIPEKLKQIKNPYLVPENVTCEQIALEVTELDALLGRDWDIPPPDKKGLSDRAADGASTALLDALSSGASSFIPYRGFVRTLSGANNHAKKVLKAYERGSHRRSFLKGIGLLKGCAYPAAPLPQPEEVPKVVFR